MDLRDPISVAILVSGLVAVSGFAGRVNTMDEPRAVPRDGAFHTSDFDDVHTDSDNHCDE